MTFLFFIWLGFSQFPLFSGLNHFFLFVLFSSLPIPDLFLFLYHNGYTRRHLPQWAAMSMIGFIYVLCTVVVNGRRRISCGRWIRAWVLVDDMVYPRYWSFCLWKEPGRIPVHGSTGGISLERSMDWIPLRRNIETSGSSWEEATGTVPCSGIWFRFASACILDRDLFRVKVAVQFIPSYEFFIHFSRSQPLRAWEVEY